MDDYMNKEYKFQDSIVSIAKGDRACRDIPRPGYENKEDYTLYDDAKLFNDSMLFECILDNNNISEHLMRMKCSSFLDFYDDFIEFNSNPDAIYESFGPDPTKIDKNLFLSILRIDVDNRIYGITENGYVLNGGIRHFAQLILLDLLKNDQDDISWITSKNIKNLIANNKNLTNKQIAKIVHDAGFPYSSITKDDWKSLYLNWI